MVESWSLSLILYYGIFNGKAPALRDWDPNLTELGAWEFTLKLYQEWLPHELKKQLVSSGALQG